jgi:hypothetical protein
MDSIQLNATGRGSSSSMPPLSVGVAKAAEIIGCSPSYLNKCRVFGGGPKWFRVGTRCLYSLADLNEFIASQQRCASTAEYKVAGGSR